MSIKIKYAQRAMSRARKKSKAAKIGTLQLWQNQLAALRRASEKQDDLQHQNWDSDTGINEHGPTGNSQSIYPFLP